MGVNFSPSIKDTLIKDSPRMAVEVIPSSVYLADNEIAILFEENNIFSISFQSLDRLFNSFGFMRDKRSVEFSNKDRTMRKYLAVYTNDSGDSIDFRYEDVFLQIISGNKYICGIKTENVINIYDARSNCYDTIEIKDFVSAYQGNNIFYDALERIRNKLAEIEERREIGYRESKFYIA